MKTRPSVSFIKKTIEKEGHDRLSLINELHGIAGKVPESTDWKSVIRNSVKEKLGK